MSRADLLCLIPFMIIAGAPVIMMLIIIISRNFRVIFMFSVLMLIAAFVSLFIIMPRIPHEIDPLLNIDYFGVLFLGIIFSCSILITIISYEYLSKQAGEREEYFIILFTAILGASILVVADHFISFFMGLETLSISLYVLISFLRTRDHNIEAGVKFLVIASLATAFLLFGMGLIYAETGTMSFHDLVPVIDGKVTFSPVLLIGTGLILTGIGFKLALVPFHMWTPDIYQGAPVPVSAFIATVSKGAVMALTLRLFFEIGGYKNETLIFVISLISVLSMFTGNLLALRQTNIKRLLAYSSIAHLGYLLITLLAGTKAGIDAAVFYVAAYIVTTLGAFGAISVLSVNERDADSIEDLKGLFWTSPRIAVVLTLSFFSFAGIPLTAGFISKFYLVLEGARSGLWIVISSLIINSVISLYYYLRIIKTMFSPAETKGKKIYPSIADIVFIIIVITILFIGVFPSFLTELIKSM